MRTIGHEELKQMLDRRDDFRLVMAHYVTRNRTQGLDSFPFFSAQDSSQTSFAVAFVYVSGTGQGVRLLSPPVALSSSLQKGCVFD